MEIGTVKPVKIEEEMRGSYLDYAMSVIVARALPDVRDGLKPVHRRILYALHDLGLRHTGRYRKSARIVGEVLGKYHPHGDAPVYEAMVRMAQDFSMRYPLVDGQGNFGSVDGDPPAAMRYTEARMAEITEEMLADIAKETVDFVPNFDGTLEEPTVLPAKLPNLLVNGSSGIAVGMATNIPPHNLGEVCDGIAHLIENPDATVEDLAAFIKGPDFPTGGIIQGTEGIKSAYSTGHGRIVIRAKAHIEETGRGRYQIVVRELPYQVNKASLVERIAELARDKRIDGIGDIRDESDREGMRLVVELKKDGEHRQVLNNLYKYTAMQTAFSTNMLALVEGQPRTISLKMALQHYINFRREVVTRRSRFDLRKAQERAHILEGLKVALDHLDEVISTIRRSQSAETARTNLMRNFGITQAQAQAILDMQLRRLAALERQKIEDEYTELLKTIAYLEDLLANPRKIDYLIREEVLQLKAKYGEPRRTLITEGEVAEFGVEDLIPHQQVVVTLSQRGYIKRLPAETYRLQHRGGKGVMGMVTREEDAVQHLLVADTHDDILFFTNRGKVFHLKCHEVPAESSRTAKGMSLVNLLSMVEEQVTALVALPGFAPGEFMVMATRQGEVKKTALAEFDSVRSSGLITFDLEKGDELVSARRARPSDQVIIATEQGKAIRFRVDPLRAASRSSGGVRGIRLGKGDRVVGMDIVSPRGYLLVVGSNGFGKRTPLREYPLQGRGGGGVRNFDVTPKTGELVAAQVVYPSQELMVISAKGQVIRTSVESVRSTGRVAQGVTIMKMEEGDRVVSIACFDGGGPAAPGPADAANAAPAPHRPP